MHHSKRTILSKAGNLSNSQHGLLIAKHCAGYCKVVYNTRTMPPDVLGPSLVEYESMLRACLDSLAGCQVDSRAWQLAGLGVSAGGIGLRSPVVHAGAAYVASFVGAGPLGGGAYLGRV